MCLFQEIYLTNATKYYSNDGYLSDFSKELQRCQFSFFVDDLIKFPFGVSMEDYLAQQSHSLSKTIALDQFSRCDLWFGDVAHGVLPRIFLDGQEFKIPTTLHSLINLLPRVKVMKRNLYFWSAKAISELQQEAA